MSGLVIGLTGGVASGKSLAADAFQNLGVPVLDADAVAREVVEPGTPALTEIVQAFGETFLLPDGTLDRRKMRERVFADEGARRRLEQITHPRIRERLLEWRDRQTAPYCVLAVPILIEMGLDSIVDRVLVIDVPEPVQLGRLQQRDGIPEPLAKRMIAAQASRETRLQHADDVIRNDGSVEQLRASVHAMHERYSAAAQSAP